MEWLSFYRNKKGWSLFLLVGNGLVNINTRNHTLKVAGMNGWVGKQFKYYLSSWLYTNHGFVRFPLVSREIYCRCLQTPPRHRLIPWILISPATLAVCPLVCQGVQKELLCDTIFSPAIQSKESDKTPWKLALFTHKWAVIWLFFLLFNGQ